MLTEQAFEQDGEREYLPVLLLQIHDKLDSSLAFVSVVDFETEIKVEQILFYTLKLVFEVLVDTHIHLQDGDCRGVYQFDILDPVVLLEDIHDLLEAVDGQELVADPFLVEHQVHVTFVQTNACVKTTKYPNIQIHFLKYLHAFLEHFQPLVKDGHKFFIILLYYLINSLR